MELYMKKLPLSSSKFIKIDTIEEEVQIFTYYPDLHAILNATVPLSLIKLVTEMNKQVFLEHMVCIYKSGLIGRNRLQRYYLSASRSFHNLVVFKDEVLFSPMRLTGYNRLTGNLWRDEDGMDADLIHVPEFSPEEWMELVGYIHRVPFKYNPKEQYQIYCDMLVTGEIFWDHENECYIEPFKPEE